MSSSTTPSTTIIVSGLDPSTTQESLDHFFSFCGKIKSIERTEKSATIIFENHSAAKTSVMLDGGVLDGSAIQVRALDEELNHLPDTKPDQSLPSPSPAIDPQQDLHSSNLNINPEGADDIKQEDKPRSAIAAEYLAHGYVLGDQAISKAIALDKKHGISAKFINYFRKIQEKATRSSSNQAPPTDSSTPAATTSPNNLTYTQKLQNIKNLTTQQYEKALKSPGGTKVYKFYTGTSKQILDVHQEAKRIAESKLGHPIFAPGSRQPENHATPSNPTGVATN